MMKPTSIRHIHISYVNSTKTVNLFIIVNWVWVLLQPPVLVHVQVLYMYRYRVLYAVPAGGLRR